MLPIHLEARVSHTFNVSEIIQNQTPDAEGNTIPASVHEGGIKVAGSQAENQHIMIVAEVGIYNVRKATCGGSCGQCDGYSSAAVVAGSFALPVNSTTQLNFMGTWNSGSQYNLGGTWGSNNTPVATVGSGLVTGISPGTATISASVVNEPVEAGYICYGNSCPTSGFGGSSGGLPFTPIQHQYPRNPLPQTCWVSRYFDSIINGVKHKAEDVVYDDGSGKKGVSPHTEPPFMLRKAVRW